jgi:hypothetical protein
VRRYVLVVVVFALATVWWPSTAAAQEPAACAVTGFTPSTGEAGNLRGRLRTEPVQELGGQRLDRARGWQLPRGTEPVVVVDSAEPLTRGSAKAVLFGLDFAVTSGTGAGTSRYVSTVTMPQLGPTVRTIGIRATSNVCGATLVLSVDRSPLSTIVGRFGLGLAVVASVLMVWVARRRPGGWLRRALLAAPLGIVAGAGEAALLQEAGVISPLSRASWWVPVVGLAIAMVLPLTRRRPASVVVAPAAGDQLFASTPVANVFRSTDAGEPVLRKVLTDPSGAALLARDAEVGAAVDHPNCLRVRRGEPGLVISDDVDGAPARRLVGTIDGPQALRITAEALTALAAVHAAGFTHADVCPDNLYVDTGGRVRLANFDLATTAEHAHEDLTACAETLGELLTGTPPVMADGEVVLGTREDEVPAAVSAFIARALTEPPTTADAMLADLESAATDAYGHDWMTLGTLTGTLLVPGGVIAAAGVGGAAGSVFATGAPLATTGAAALGTGAGLTATASSVGIVSVQTAATKVPIVTPVLAVVAAAAITTAAVLASPTPAQANPELVTPELAKVIFVNTLGEVRANRDDHVSPTIVYIVTALRQVTGFGTGAVSNVVVAVPRGQRTYIAYFFAYAEVKLPNGKVAYLFARFERGAADKPWVITSLNFSIEGGFIAPPARDPDGYLAPTPPDSELVLDPATIPARYAELINRAEASQTVGTDPLLDVREGGLLGRVAARENFVHPERLGQVASIDYTAKPGSTRTDRVPLADGTVLVLFDFSVHSTAYNRPTLGVTGPCNTTFGYLFYTGSPNVHYRQLDRDYVGTFEARVPLKNWTAPASPAPAPSASASPSVVASAPAGTTAPGAPRKARIDDWNYHTENAGGVPC